MPNTIHTGNRLYAMSKPWALAFEFFLINHTAPGFKPALATKIEFTEQPEGFQFTEPSFTLHADVAQELFDSLYAAGLRPSRPTEYHASLNAHLQDMRAIAFDKLKVDRPDCK